MVDYTNYRKHYAENLRHNTTPKYSSFSSTLLDSVYRSIDQGDNDILNSKEAMRKEQHSDKNSNCHFENEEAIANFQRTCMIEKWMEKKESEKADLQKKVKSRRYNFSSGSSDFSYDGSSFLSETESFPVQRPKPVRTRESEFVMKKICQTCVADELELKTKTECGFIKTKSRAFRIYSDLKKIKQPISPGGKITGFLNSIFTSGNMKKVRIFNNHAESPSTKSMNTSTCSSTSSFSRSCLSKTPSSAKSTNTAKRSVRFFPISVIVDENCQPCGHKSIHGETKYNYDSIIDLEKLQLKSANFSSGNIVNKEVDLVNVLEKNRRVEEVAKELLRNYQKKSQEFDDAASYASSDLFELDNLGMEKYLEELPVYGTTHISY